MWRAFRVQTYPVHPTVRIHLHVGFDVNAVYTWQWMDIASGRLLGRAYKTYNAGLRSRTHAIIQNTQHHDEHNTWHQLFPRRP